MERSSSKVENLELRSRTEPSPQSGTNDSKNQKNTSCKTKCFGFIILSLILVIILMAIFWSLDNKEKTSTKGNSGSF